MKVLATFTTFHYPLKIEILFGLITKSNWVSSMSVTVNILYFRKLPDTVLVNIFNVKDLFEDKCIVWLVVTNYIIIETQDLDQEEEEDCTTLPLPPSSSSSHQLPDITVTYTKDLKMQENTKTFYHQQPDQ